MPPVPAQVRFRPNEVTPARTFEPPRKFGPPESPKQVPPLFVLFERSSAKSPTKPVLICKSHGVATILWRIAMSFHPAASGNDACRPYPTAVKVVETPG